jgi:hypothetical protein
LGGTEDFEVALGPPVLCRAVEDVAGGGFAGDLFQREGRADEVLGQAGATSYVVGCEGGFPGIKGEAAVVLG